MRWPWDVLAEAIRATGEASTSIAAAIREWRVEKPDPLRFDPTRDRDVRCPKCKTDAPPVPLSVLERPVIRGIELEPMEFVPLVGGRLYACLRCPAIYAVGRDGAFEVHRDSYVHVRHNPEADRLRQTLTETADGEPDRPLNPAFRERPSL